MRQLTRAGQIASEAWKDMPKCTRGIFCSCETCEHPGNPRKQTLNPDCWEDEPDAPPPRGRMRDWVQT